LQFGYELNSLIAERVGETRAHKHRQIPPSSKVMY